MERLTAPVKRFLLSLLALGFLIGSSIGAMHVHALLRSDHRPAASTGGHPHEDADAICPICRGQQVAGHGLTPGAPGFGVPLKAAPVPIDQARTSCDLASLRAF
jgi:hypothetical protein